MGAVSTSGLKRHAWDLVPRVRILLSARPLVSATFTVRDYQLTTKFLIICFRAVLSTGGNMAVKEFTRRTSEKVKPGAIRRSISVVGAAPPASPDLFPAVLARFRRFPAIFGMTAEALLHPRRAVWPERLCRFEPSVQASPYSHAKNQLHRLNEQ